MIDARVIASAPFDSEANIYDEKFENNPVTHNIRPIIWQRLLKHFHPGDHVLDLNCGTGTDAIMLAQKGIRVTGVDSSLQMMELARKKSNAQQFENMIDFHHLSFESLDQFDGTLFDGIFSNFGGLNCSNNLPDVIKKVHSLLKPNGFFIGCFINKFSLWEMMSFLLRGKVLTAFRRTTNNEVLVRINETQVPVRYYSLHQLSQMMEPYFRITASYGLNIFSPSPSSRSFVASYPRLTQRLLKFDSVLRYRKPWNGFGDHLGIEMQRISQND